MQYNPNATELLELEKHYWRALRDHDLQTILSLSDDPCVVTGPQGVGRIDRKTMAMLMETAKWKLEDFELKDETAQVTMIGNDVGIVAYDVHEELTVDGSRLALDAAESSTWVRRDGHWVCAQHSEALLGDPFGRDRQGITTGRA